MGETKVFLRSGQMAELDAKRAEMLNNAARTIQRQVRTFLARRHLIAMRRAVVTIQKYWRGMGCGYDTDILARFQDGDKYLTLMDFWDMALPGLWCVSRSSAVFCCRAFVQGVLLESGMQGCVKKLQQYISRRMFGCGLLERSSSR